MERQHIMTTETKTIYYIERSGEFIEANNAVPIYFDLPLRAYFFTHRNDNGEWYVYEATTGKRISSNGKSRAKVITTAIGALHNYQQTSFDRLVDGYTKTPFVPYDLNTVTPDTNHYCDRCGTIYEPDGEELLCADCLEDMVTCHRCSATVSEDDATNRDDEWYCTDCFDHLFFICDDCANVYSADDAREVHHRSYCETCFDERFTECDVCGSFINRDEACYEDDGDTTYCSSCYDERKKNIHEYHHYSGGLHYHPAPYDNNLLYLGVELETDKYDVDPKDCASDLVSNHSDDETKFHCEHDGSLNSGFEIVSQPAVLDYHINEMDWEAITTCVRRNGGLSNDTETCGLHIHFSRSFWGDTYDINALKLLYIFERFWNNFVKISRRHGDHWTQYAKRYNDDFTDCPDVHYKIQETVNKGRYYAVNLEPRRTVEIRIFKGTLKVNTIYSCLELVDFLARYVSTVTIIGLQSTTWDMMTDQIDRTKYPHLINYLNNHNLLKGGK